MSFRDAWCRFGKPSCNQRPVVLPVGYKWQPLWFLGHMQVSQQDWALKKQYSTGFYLVPSYSIQFPVSPQHGHEHSTSNTTQNRQQQQPRWLRCCDSNVEAPSAKKQQTWATSIPVSLLKGKPAESWRKNENASNQCEWTVEVPTTSSIVNLTCSMCIHAGVRKMYTISPV